MVNRDPHRFQTFEACPQHDDGDDPSRPRSGGMRFPLAASVAALTVDVAVRERAMARPERTALVQDGCRISYGELLVRVDRLCRLLHRLGVRRGDRIAVLSENRTEYVEVLLAAATLGAIVACQNWRLVGAELAHCLRLVEPRVALASPRHAETLGAVAHGARRGRSSSATSTSACSRARATAASPAGRAPRTSCSSSTPAAPPAIRRAP